MLNLPQKVNLDHAEQYVLAAILSTMPNQWQPSCSNNWFTHQVFYTCQIRGINPDTAALIFCDYFNDHIVHRVFGRSVRFSVQRDPPIRITVPENVFRKVIYPHLLKLDGFIPLQANNAYYIDLRDLIDLRNNFYRQALRNLYRDGRIPSLQQLCLLNCKKNGISPTQLQLLPQELRQNWGITLPPPQNVCTLL